MSKLTSTSPEDMHETILDAVGRLLQRYGYKKMTVEDIAREAEIGKGTIYLYFQSKEDVALSWMDRINVQLQEELRRIAASSDSSPNRLKQMLITRVVFRFDSAQHFIESFDDLFGAGPIRQSLHERHRRNHEAEAAILKEVIEGGLRDATLTACDACAIADALLVATNSLLPYSLSVCQLGNRDEIQSKVTTVADLLLNGLVRRDARSK